jgi:hypothetical protein
MFTKTFRRGDLRKQIIQNLLDQETSLLPRTMDLLEQRKKATIHNELASELYTKVTRAIQEPITDDQKAEITTIINKLQANDGFSKQKKRKEMERKYTKCPKQGCNGYITGSAAHAAEGGPKISLQCSICKYSVCRDCNATIPTETVHTQCNPDDKASWTLIKESSKPCPKCGTPIERASGCYQMWCTVENCNTAFSWTDGRIVNGPVHNPHYFEWLTRSQNVQTVQNPNMLCDNNEILNQVHLHRLFQLLKLYFHTGKRSTFLYLRHTMDQGLNGVPQSIIDEEVYKRVSSKCETVRQRMAFLQEVQDMQWRLDRRSMDYTCDSYEDLRISFLEGAFTRERWATKISVRETTRIKRKRIFLLHTMFTHASVDLFVNFSTDAFKDAGLDLFSAIDANQTYMVPNLETFLDSFITSFQTLLEYFRTEKIQILSDYSDQTASVPVVMNNIVSMQKVPIDKATTACQASLGP